MFGVALPREDADMTAEERRPRPFHEKLQADLTAESIQRCDLPALRQEKFGLALESALTIGRAVSPGSVRVFGVLTVTGLRIDPLGAADAAAAGRLPPQAITTIQRSASSSPTRGSATEYSSRSRPPPGCRRPRQRCWCVSGRSPGRSRAVAAARPVSADPLRKARMTPRCCAPPSRPPCIPSVRAIGRCPGAGVPRRAGLVPAGPRRPSRRPTPRRRRGIAQRRACCRRCGPHRLPSAHIGPIERRVLPQVGIPAHPTPRSRQGPAGRRTTG